MRRSSSICEACGAPMSEPPHCARCSQARFTSDDDDDQPYDVTGDTEQEPCLGCGKPLPRGALLCNHCGFNQQTGETLQRVYKKIDKHWEAGLRFQARLGTFLAISGLAAVGTIVAGIIDGNLPALLISWLVVTPLWAFLLGTYPRIDLTRSKAGQVQLTKTWRCCFFPLEAADIRWRGCGGVAIARSGDTDMWDWLTLLFLAMWGFFPALLWWYYAVRPDQFDVALTKEHGYPAILLYRGRNEAMAQEIAAKLRSVMGVP